MTLILDSGGVLALAENAKRVAALRDDGFWPPIIPADVLTECLTGDHRRDFHVDRLIHVCLVKPVTEIIARHAATLRYAVKHREISAVDAIVAAFADQQRGAGLVLTTDPDDLRALAENTLHRVRVAPV